MSHMIFALQYFKIVFFFFLIYIFIYLLSSGFYWDRSTGKDLSSFWNSNTIPMVWHDLSPRVHGVLLHTCSTTTYHFPYGKRRRFGSSIQNVHLRPTPTYHHTASFGPQVMYLVFKKKLIWQKCPFHVSDVIIFFWSGISRLLHHQLSQGSFRFQLRKETPSNQRHLSKTTNTETAPPCYHLLEKWGEWWVLRDNTWGSSFVVVYTINSFDWIFLQ